VALNRYGGTALQGTPRYRMWAERADRSAAPDSRERVWADHALAFVHHRAGDYEEARALRQRALELARTLGDTEAFVLVAMPLLVAHVEEVEQQEARRALATEVAALPREQLAAFSQAWALLLSGAVLWIGGEREQAERAWAKLEELAQQTQDPTAQLL